MFLFGLKLFLSIILPSLFYRATKKSLLQGEVRNEEDYRVYMASVIKEYNKIRYGDLVRQNKQQNRKKRLIYYTITCILFSLSIYEEYPYPTTEKIPLVTEEDDWPWCLLSGSSDQFCHVGSRYWWRLEDAGSAEYERRYFIDEKEELLFTTKLHYPNLLYPFEPQPSNTIALVRESHLLAEVAHLARINALECICGTFLGLVDNIVFLRRQNTETWIILYDAYIHHNSVTAHQIESVVAFPEKWMPYSTKIKHYNQFIISFRTINQRNPYLFNKNNSQHITLQRLRLNRTKEALMLELDGSDAICYVHCQRLQTDIGSH